MPIYYIDPYTLETFIIFDSVLNQPRRWLDAATGKPVRTKRYIAFL